LMSLRGPSPTALAVTIRNIKAAESDTGPSARDREQEFLQAVQSAAERVGRCIKVPRRDCSVEDVSQTIASLLAAGFAGTQVPATAAAAPTASCSSGQ
jgi:hypothetical protein